MDLGPFLLLGPIVACTSPALRCRLQSSTVEDRCGGLSFASFDQPQDHAEVVRDLYRPGTDSGQSFSERQLYETALERLSDEVALVDVISKEQAVVEIEALMKAGPHKRSA